ncbi:MAG: MATE family efflux transporter [Propionibacteriaceae bacterium]|jgi:putative MATE family efflux protein|nr:MATE family efflux transporter [Propionibacteriaceae bacterium]
MTTNLTVGHPTRSIVAFTIPLLIGNLFQQVYAFTDAAVVGRLIDVNALAAVGAAGSLQFLLIGFTFGASGGLAIPTARAFGAGDMAAMRRYVAAGLALSAGISIVITAIGVLGAHGLLTALHTPAALIADTEAFLVVSFLGTSVTMAYNFLGATIRALGDSRTPLYFLIIACVLNAGLVAFFIGVLKLGVIGASAATVLAQFVSVVLCLLLIAKRMPQLRIRRADWRFSRAELGETARLGLAMGFQMSVIAVGAVVLQYAINTLGPDAIAAFTASVRVDQMASTPLSSFGLAMATYVAQNRGARQWDRIRVGVFRIMLVVIGAAVTLGALVIVTGRPIVELFLGPDEPHIAEMAHQYLIVSGVCYAILALLFLYRNTIQGLGATAVPTVAGAMELVLRAGSGIFLVSHIGFWGVCLASPLAWLGALIPTAIAWMVERRRLIERGLSEQGFQAEVAHEIASGESYTVSEPAHPRCDALRLAD